MQPFFTAVDERATIKGSRDPLGFEIIWSAFRRKQIKNLTTISAFPHEFAICLLGHYFAQLDEKALKNESLLCERFLKFEQFWGGRSFSDFAFKK